MSYLYRDLGLRANPFDPAIADRRDPEDIILEGTRYIAYVKRIMYVISELKKETSSILFLVGPIGSGKTAIIKRALYDLGRIKLVSENFSVNEVSLVNGKKALVFYVKPEIGDKFKDMLRRIIEYCLKVILKEKLPEDKSRLENPDFIADTLTKVSEVCNAEGIVIFLDQVERMREIDEKCVLLLREIYNRIRCGLLLIISSVDIPELRSLEDLARKYIGSVDIIYLEGIERSEIEIWLEKILEHYRLPGFTPPHKLYPFTKEGIEIFLNLLPSEAFIKPRSLVVPRILYCYLSRILNEAAEKGLVPIDGTNMTLLMSRIGGLEVEWFVSLNEPPRHFRDAVSVFFELLDGIKTVELGPNKALRVMYSINVRRLKAHEDIEELLGKLFEFKEGIKHEDLVSSFKRAIDIVTILEFDKARYVYFVKASVRPRRSTVKAFEDFFKNIRSVKVPGGILHSEAVRFKLVVPDSVPSTVGERLKISALGLADVIKVERPWIVDSQNHQSYGALMYLHKKYKKEGTDIIKDGAVRNTVTTLVKQAFEELFITE